MTALIGIFFTSFIVALSGALMPGPLLTTTVSESTQYGPKAGPLLIVGHSILEFMLVVLLFLGLAPLLSNRVMTAIVSIIGGAILFWLAFGMFRSLPSLSLDSTSSPERSEGHLIRSGIVISLSNPYWIIWWATVGLAYILQAKTAGYLGVVVFFIGHILADFVWYAVVSLIIGKGRSLLSPKFYKGIVGVCSGFLVIFGVFFFWNGMKMF